MTEAVFPIILHQFNFSEIAGNATAVAISMPSYPENRDVLDGVSRLGSQTGVDTASNILKELAGPRTEIFAPEEIDPGLENYKGN